MVPDTGAVATGRRWAPWRLAPIVELARDAAGQGLHADAVVLYRQALHRSPTNGYLWAELAAVLAQRLDDPDAFAQALAHSTQFAPNSRAIRQHNALLADRLWYRAPEHLSPLLSAQFAEALALAPEPIQRALFESGRSIHSCVAFGDQGSFQAWCERSVEWLQQCRRGKRHPRARPRCPSEYR